MIKILIGSGIVALFGYLALWVGYHTHRLYERRKQQQRANHIWQHYQDQQHDHLSALMQEDPSLETVSTLRKWPQGEHVSLMMSQFLWWRLSAEEEIAREDLKTADSAWQDHQMISMRMQHDTSRVEKTVERLLVQTHLFVTNRRIVLVADAQTEISFVYKYMQDVDLYVDTIVITFITGDRLVIHNHYQPDTIAKFYQIVHYHYHREHAG
ncbi:hypothetical protein PVA44_07095 (plasmid) [Entomospira nematocerorum]|uniref:Uncharacterized protein n=1 Tax=Entomospira nematocerorum TaxID=2719987 RepID=A0A968KVT7_9SPIO|nr:hypothetical protein [Entomospira nematocera]NIZ47673.1 hypothetical protein [Entomospira nematocera]WDI34565.1 hypothetical protein PVA44_07095 [Entomospira nematocera]